MRILFSTLLALGIAYYGYNSRSLTFSGAVLGFLVGGITFFCGGSAYGIILIAFFLSSSRISKYKFKTKVKRLRHLPLKKGGSRDWSHVLSSSIIACAISVYHYVLFGVHRPLILGSSQPLRTALLSAYIGHYASCTGDHWASEIGALEKAMPFLITKCRRVPRGTNGAISVTGTTASIAGGAFIGAVYYFMSAPEQQIQNEGVGKNMMQWPVIILGATCGFAGSMVDSMLGSILQYSGWSPSRQAVVQKPEADVKHICGVDLLSNNQVNFFASLIISIVTGLLGPAFFDSFKI